MNRNSITAALLAGAMILSLAGCGKKETTEAEAPAAAGVAVQVQTVQKDDIATENKVSGSIAADREAVIMVAVTAKCVEKYFEAGDMVEAGQILCKLDLDSTMSTYHAASIGYNSAAQSYRDQKAVFDSQIALQKKNVEDLKALFAIGAASQMEIDAAELQLQSTIATKNATLAQLQAGMENSKSSVESLNTALENIDSNGNVIAPISGVLVSMNAVKDSFLAQTAPVAVIDATDAMKVTVSVSEALVPKLSIGDKAAVNVSAADLSFDGTIRAVEQAANMVTKLYNVTLEVPVEAAESGKLLSGMFADVTFKTDESTNTVIVPTEAIMPRGESYFVYVVENDTAKQVEVKTGLTGAGVTEITSGLAGGEQLVTVGQAYLSDGAAVRIVSGGK